jgi:hypothetical protein
MKARVGWDTAVGISTRYGWEVRESNPGEGEIFRTLPNPPWGPPILLYNRYGSSQGVKWPGVGFDHPHTLRADVNERVGLYIY